MHLKSARRLAANSWEINGFRSRDGEEEIENGEAPRIGNLFGSDTHQSHRPVRKVAGHSSVRTRLKDASCSLVASKQLIKVLIRLWSQEEHSPSGLTLVSALRAEIDRAKHQVDQLMNEKNHVYKDQIDALLEQFAYEKAAWRSEEQDRIFNAVSSLARELVVEKKMRRQAERLNRRLGQELADTRAQLKERKTEEILEQKCEYEGKNAAMEKLRSELEVFLGGKEGKCKRECDDDEGEEDEDEEEELSESELHSIELNEDQNWKWSHVDQVFKGSEKIQWEGVCLQRKGSNGVEWDFTDGKNRRQVNACRSDGRKDYIGWRGSPNRRPTKSIDAPKR